MPDTHWVSDNSPTPAPPTAPHAGHQSDDTADRRHPRRNLIGVLVAVLVVLLVAAAATALIDRGHPDSGWAALPDPLTLNNHTPAALDGARGQTLAIGGGQGNGTITAMTGRAFPASVLADIVCKGDGDVTIAGVGAAGCYDGNITAYEITRPAGPTGSLMITAPPGVLWRITISTYIP